MTRYRLKANDLVMVTLSRFDPLDAFGAIHRAAACYSRDTPLTIEAWQDGEWRSVYPDDEWRGPIAAE